MEFEHLLEKQEHKDFVPTDFAWIINKFEEELGNKLSRKGGLLFESRGILFERVCIHKVVEMGGFKGFKNGPEGHNFRI